MNTPAWVCLGCRRLIGGPVLGEAGRRQGMVPGRTAVYCAECGHCHGLNPDFSLRELTAAEFFKVEFECGDEMDRQGFHRPARG